MPKQTTDAQTIDDTKEVDPAEANTELPNGEVETEISEGDVPTPTGESVDEDLEDDAEAEEPAEGADEDKPKADKGEDQEARRSKLLDRIEKWGEPAPAQPKAEAKEETKAEDKKPEPRKPSEKLKTARAKFVEKYGEDDAAVFFDPQAEEIEATRAELDTQVGETRKLAEKTAATLSKLEEREQARSLEVAIENTNRLGKEVAAVASKGYEHVFGKVGAYDPRTDRFKDSTEAQNQNIAKFNQKTVEYLTKSRAAGDPLSIEDARELALMKLEKDDPAFKRNVAAEKTAENRQRQITVAPTRHKAGRGPVTDAKEDPYAAAKNAARNGYSQFLGKNRE